MIKKYRKKPVVIEAMQWDGTNRAEILLFAPRFTHTEGGKGLFIKTIEGSMEASIGDYIIKGIKGEFYPCKPDIFALTYEEDTPND